MRQLSGLQVQLSRALQLRSETQVQSSSLCQAAQLRQAPSLATARTVRGTVSRVDHPCSNMEAKSGLNSAASLWREHDADHVSVG